MAKLGEIVRAARKKQKLTVQELAGKLKKSPGYISRIEARGEIPTDEMLVGMAKLLRLNIKEISQAVKEDVLDRAHEDLDQRLEELLVLYRRSD